MVVDEKYLFLLWQREERKNIMAWKKIDGWTPHKHERKSWPAHRKTSAVQNHQVWLSISLSTVCHLLLYAQSKSAAISVSTDWPHSLKASVWLSLNVCSLAFEQRAWQTCCKIKVTSLHQLAARFFPVPSASCEICCQKSVFTTRLRPQINVLLLKSTSDYFTLRCGTDGPWWEQDLLFWNLTLSFHLFWIPSCCHDNAALDPLHPTFPSSSSSSSMSDFHVSKYNRQTGWRREGETRRCERFVNRCRVRVNVQVSWWMITP